MKAIQVKYLSPTNTKGSRIKVMAEGVKSITLGYHYTHNDCGRLKAAYLLCEANGWPKELVEGQLPNGDYVFCFKNQMTTG